MEASADVRSIPLGAKRKRGRPKKLPNCLVKSPIRAVDTVVTVDHTMEEETEDSDEDEAVSAPVHPRGKRKRNEPIGCDAPLKMTSRKRQRKQGDVPHPDGQHHDDEQESGDPSPVVSLIGQARILRPGLGASKPPKKTKKMKEKPNAVPHVVPTSSPAAPSSSAPLSTNLPPAVQCKKKANTCNHEVVFGQHYNRVLWKKYAESVNLKKSSVQIDPNYVS